MTLLEQYKKNRFSLAPFGIDKGETRSSYFCTPRGACILGWTGADGIHYCTVRSLGETVFAVNPYADPKKHAFPVAENFETFLQLLITCKEEVILESAHAWTRKQFDQFCMENPCSDEQQQAAQLLAQQFSLSPLEDPYACLKEIYDSFDFDTIPYPKDYYEFVPVEPEIKPQDWKIYYSSCGTSAQKRERSGKEMSIEKHLSFDGYDWYIPSAYICTQGIVLDMLAKIPDREILHYYETYGREDDTDGKHSVGIEKFLSREERMTMEAENPFARTFSATLTVNGRTLTSERCRGDQFLSRNVLSEIDETPAVGTEMDVALLHYGLSADDCWMLRRFAFPWKSASKPKVQNIRIHLKPHPVEIPGTRFRVDTVGQKIVLHRPTTHTDHTLTVTRYENGVLHQPKMQKSIEFPNCYTEISYTLTPEIPDHILRIQDVRSSDATRRTPSADVESSAIAIIGGADGPTAVSFAKVGGTNETALEHTALSALTWEKQSHVEWLCSFRETLSEEVSTVLLEEMHV